MDRAHGPSFQSILLPLSEADELVDKLRVDGDWSRGLGVPAHITLAGPWPTSHSLPLEPLAEIGEFARGASFQLGSIGLLGEAVCLFPDDDRSLEQLRAHLLGVAGAPDSTNSSWRPHLTICRSGGQGALDSVRAEIRHALPMPCVVADLYVVAVRRNKRSAFGQGAAHLPRLTVTFTGLLAPWTQG